VPLKGGHATLTAGEVERVAARFTRPAYESFPDHDDTLAARLAHDKAFAAWHRRNVHAHKVPGYAAVTLSLKRAGIPPGDATADELDAIAALAERFSGGELRVSHEQNLIFADVARRDLHALWTALRALRLATPNVGLLTNIVSCPGGDFCSLANARSLPIAAAIRARFDDLDYLFDVGELDLNISGCMNACGHHHVGHIGILGVDKNGAEFYQIEIGGNQGETRPGARVALGKTLGRSFAADEVPDAIERLVNRYLELREGEAERFIDTVQRVGTDPFKASLYGTPDQTPQTRSRRLAAA
jgi:sulfite reductase (NADPH) hemoprotein beta-component